MISHTKIFPLFTYIVAVYFLLQTIAQNGMKRKMFTLWFLLGNVALVFIKTEKYIYK
jgi:hypothetical protein